MVKDNICTEGIPTTCSFRMLQNFVPPYDAHVIELFEAGRHRWLSPTWTRFAMGSSTENSAFAITANPWDLSRVPGGSSGGSAAAVSAMYAPMALGSDTGGSIRQPASYCGVVGIKPTYGAVSRYGLVAFASSLDQIGPLRARWRMRHSLNVICGHDHRDSTSMNIAHPDYTQGIKDGVKGMKIGLPKEYFGEGLDKDVKDAIMKAARAFEKLGATVEETTLPTFDYALAAYYIISSAEATQPVAVRRRQVLTAPSITTASWTCAFRRATRASARK